MRYVPVKGQKLLSNYFIFCDCVLEIGNSVFQRNFFMLYQLPIVLVFFIFEFEATFGVHIFRI